MCVYLPADWSCHIHPRVWDMLAEEQRRRLGIERVPAESAISEVQLSVVPPPSVEQTTGLGDAPANGLTEEEQAAADAADAAYRDLERRLAALHAGSAPRAKNCGSTCTLHLRRERDGHVEDCLARLPCDNSSCPHCWRRRRAKCCRRAAGCLLELPAGAVRSCSLHVGETTWDGWAALDKAIRRQHGGKVGRLRVRRADDTVLVVCEGPFRGSRPVTPGTALALVATAVIDCLSKRRQSYRQLGLWQARRETTWKLVQEHDRGIDLAEVQRQLEELQVRSRQLKSPNLAVLLWRTDSEAAADALAARLTALQAPRVRLWPSGDTGIPRGAQSDVDEIPDPPPFNADDGTDVPGG
jgi:hypothetical protein